MIEYFPDGSIRLSPNPPKRKPRYVRVVRKPTKSAEQKSFENMVTKTINDAVRPQFFYRRKPPKAKGLILPSITLATEYLVAGIRAA